MTKIIDFENYRKKVVTEKSLEKISLTVEEKQNIRYELAYDDDNYISEMMNGYFEELRES